MELLDILCSVGERYIFSHTEENIVRIEDRENDLVVYIKKKVSGEVKTEFCVTNIYNSECNEQKISMQALIDLKKLVDMVCNTKKELR